MGVRAVTCVWESSRAKGSELLVLLKIADWADEDGRNSWGSVVKIAALSRMTERAVRDILKRLVAMGELEIEKNVERRVVRNGHCPRAFMHVCCARQPEESSGLVGRAKRKKLPVEPEESSGSTKSETGTGTYIEPEAGRTPIRKIRQGSVSTSALRAREGRRPHPLDEPPVVLPRLVALFDELVAAYPRKDPDRRIEAERAWQALHLTVEQAEFAVAHVRMRAAAGWVDQAGGERFLPMLFRYIERRSWQVRAAPSGVAAGGLEGMRTIRCCDACGTELEGRVVNGQPEFPPCSRCASASQVPPEARREEPRV